MLYLFGGSVGKREKGGAWNANGLRNKCVIYLLETTKQILIKGARYVLSI